MANYQTLSNALPEKNAFFWSFVQDEKRKAGVGGILYTCGKVVIKETVAGDRPFDWRVYTLQPPEGTKAKVVISPLTCCTVYTEVQHI